MKKFFKQTIASLAAASIILSSTLPVKADVNYPSLMEYSKKGSLKIYKYDITSATKDGVYKEDEIKSTGQSDQSIEEKLANYAIEGVEFTYLRVGDVETYSEKEHDKNQIKLVYEIPTQLSTILNLDSEKSIEMPCTHTGISHFEGQEIQDSLKKLLETDDVKAKDALENYVISNNESVSMDLTDKNGYTSKDNLDLGLYLLVETKVPEEVTDTVNPWFVQLPFTNVEGKEWIYDMSCYPKNQTGNPSLDKGVKNQEESEYHPTTTASEGDVVDYILVSKLPHISSKSTYLSQYTFVDKLSEGLSYNKNVQLAFYANKEDAFKNNVEKADEVWDLTSDGFVTDYVEVREGTNETGETSLKVSFTKKGLELLNTTKSDYYVVVYYSATIHSDATTILGDNGNPNDVILTWERSSEGYLDTLEDRCYVYAFGVDLTKTFSDKKGDATKVNFIVYNSKDGYYVTAKESGVNEESKKVYYVTGQSSDKASATVFSPDKEGQLVVDGLEADTYELIETATDSGYSLLKDKIVIDITSTTREIIPSQVGAVGRDKTSKTLKENSHIHTDACYDKTNQLICGKGSLDEANGRTINKVAMFEGEIIPASATVDAKESEMKNYTVTTISRTQAADSKHGLVQIGVRNEANFKLPLTGGNGVYFVTIFGVLAVAIGVSSF
ncbi:putative surface protein [Lachnospiraceae bacterium TWA4]|nr:putative surface protein [Lachnospiraceae bacterium TWA4]